MKTHQKHVPTKTDKILSQDRNFLMNFLMNFLKFIKKMI